MDNPTKLITEKVQQTVYKLDGRPSIWRVVVDELKDCITIEGNEFSLNDDEGNLCLHMTREEAQELAYLLTEATKEPMGNAPKEPGLYRLQPAAVGSDYAVAVVDCISNKTLFYLMMSGPECITASSSAYYRNEYPKEVNELVKNFVAFCKEKKSLDIYSVDENKMLSLYTFNEIFEMYEASRNE